MIYFKSPQIQDQMARS